MIASALIRKIRTHRGKLLVPVHSLNGTMHVAVEKRDLILQLSRFGDNECEYTMIEMDDGSKCIDSDHDAYKGRED
jgi:hypothetical protein